MLTAADHAAFLAAIIDRPDDDGPRLVYADALDEAGDPRGEFIRVGCELARDFSWCLENDRLRRWHCSPDDPPPRYDTLRRRQRELLRHIDPGWLSACFPGVRPEWEGCTYFPTSFDSAPCVGATGPQSFTITIS